MRNVWSFMIIFCGHFPDGTQEFTVEETENETRGEWYFRQMLGSANLTGGKLFHLLSGNLSHQIEHHLFPDMPAHRYAEIARRGAGDLRALRHPLQHRPAAQAVRLSGEEDLPPGTSRDGVGACADPPGLACEPRPTGACTGRN